MCVRVCERVFFFFVCAGREGFFLRNDKTVPIYRAEPVLSECPQRYHF